MLGRIMIIVIVISDAGEDHDGDDDYHVVYVKSG